MKDELLSEDIAKIAKEKGFNESCLYWYGAYEKNFTFNGVTYLAILVNND